MNPEKPSIYAPSAELLAAMANEKRLLALMILADGEISVSDLAPRLGLSNSALSQHLGMMRESGLVTRRQERHKAYYSCTDLALKVLELLDCLLSGKLCLAATIIHKARTFGRLRCRDFKARHRIVEICKLRPRRQAMAAGLDGSFSRKP
ncbi:metalloregulator ArsR/SmtB family transcription factor [Mesorhizobium ciceri]|uniref:ArsR/SmtB family transcription factor n=1 Tax=Mesorhizobium ciceri TaxID=39645 RepID=UPI001428C148|nr:metalloregulator ArsR/SmtB family transcription factor [Mesorhizobium ciceri]